MACKRAGVRVPLAPQVRHTKSILHSIPVYPYGKREQEFIARVREGIQKMGKLRPQEAQERDVHLVEFIIENHLSKYLEPGREHADRLYVLEFQGPWPYVKFGHATNLLRRVTEHQRPAAAHGYVLVNGWASPWVSNAQPLEQEALEYGNALHRRHFNERFYNMSYELDVMIARYVFEQRSDWSTRNAEKSGP